MLFNSAPFLFVFLPVTLLGYYLILHRFGKLPSQLWLFGASVFFYGWWNPVYVFLILISMGFNYVIGQQLLKKRSKALLAFGLTANLLVLAYFKYMMFFLSNLNWLAGTDFIIPQIVLPLGISFFTFQKVAFLVDCYKRQVPKEQNLINFGLFISFFPQLIAGPIVHHKEMMPQFHRPARFSSYNMAVGLSLLAIGLFKKVFIADTLDAFAHPLFVAAETRELHVIEAWCAMLGYTFQLYFDFSGYSDMALGLGRMFGIKLPVNFWSPYKAASATEFWRRWHMTLSRFLRDYLYIPLGGNRKGSVRRYTNLFLTMLLGGLWHGAGWTFVIWGAMHGTYLIINHAWRAVKPFEIPRWAGVGLTFAGVAAAWVYFKAKTAAVATSILASLWHFSDLKGVNFFDALLHSQSPLRQSMERQTATAGVVLIIASFLICWLLPNSIEIMRRSKPVVQGVRMHAMDKSRFAKLLTWDLRLRWGIVTGIVAGLCIIKVLYEPSQVFLYFQF